MIGRMLLALGVVLGVMWAIARVARRPLAGKSDKAMTVLARQQLGRNTSVAVLKLADRALVIGVSEQGVRLLTETELAPLQEALSAATPGRSGAARAARSGGTRRAPGGHRATPHALPATTPRFAPEVPEFATSVPDFAMNTSDFATAMPQFATSTSEFATVTPEPSSASGHRGGRTRPKSALDGSILSPGTWSQLVTVARDMTVRR